MSEKTTIDKKSFKTVQHIQLTIREIKSAMPLGTGGFESTNGIAFTHVETVGMVHSSPTVKDEYVIVTISSTLGQSPETVSLYGGMNTDKRMLDFMSMLQPSSLVIVRGKLSITEQPSGDARYTIYPNQINDGLDVKTRDLWYYKLLLSRVNNHYPLISGDELFSIAEENGLSLSGSDDGAMATINVTITPTRAVESPPPVAVEKTPAMVPKPAARPTLPAQIGKTPAKTTINKDSIVSQISIATGLTSKEVEERANEFTDDGNIPLVGALLELAKSLSVTIDGSKPVPKPAVEKPAPAKTPATKNKPAAKPAKGSSTREKIIELIRQNGGEIAVNTLYATMKETNGIDDRISEAEVVSMSEAGIIDVNENKATLV
jgi:hypothetical protein